MYRTNRIIRTRWPKLVKNNVVHSWFSAFNLLLITVITYIYWVVFPDLLGTAFNSVIACNWPSVESKTYFVKSLALISKTLPSETKQTPKMTLIPPPTRSQKESPTQNACFPKPPAGDKERGAIAGSEGTFLSEGTMWGAFYRTQGSLPGKEMFSCSSVSRISRKANGVGVICLLPVSLSPRNQTKDNGKGGHCTKVHTQTLVGSHSLAHSTGRHSKSCSEWGTSTEEQSLPILVGACGNDWATSAVGASPLCCETLDKF